MVAPARMTVTGVGLGLLECCLSWHELQTAVGDPQLVSTPPNS